MTRIGVPIATMIVLVAGVPLNAQTVVLNGSSEGADVIVQGAIDDGSSPTPAFRAIWHNVPGGMAEFELQRTTDIDARLMMDRLIEAGIGAYMDARVHFTRDGVKADLPNADMVRDINAMMSAAIEALGAEVAFAGLSEPTRTQLDRLLRIDWSQATFGVDGGAEQDKYLAIYYYVRSQREELERQLRADLLPLSTIGVLDPDQASPGTSVRINSTCGTVFDEQNFLCALDLQLADTGSGTMDPELGNALADAMEQRHEGTVSGPEQPQQGRIHKRDRWLKSELDAINQRIDRMDQRKELWELRDRMEDIEDRMTGIELDVQEVRENATTTGDNPMANLSDLTGHNLTVHFERYSNALEPDQQVLLNEVFEQLARSPQDKVLITGYTDRSGDPAVNLRLSEQRAKAVRSYLLARGIDGDRLLVNYYGDSRSAGRDPGERRVEIEWLR